MQKHDAIPFLRSGASCRGSAQPPSPHVDCPQLSPSLKTQRLVALSLFTIWTQLEVHIVLSPTPGPLFPWPSRQGPSLVKWHHAHLLMLLCGSGRENKNQPQTPLPPPPANELYKQTRKSTQLDEHFKSRNPSVKWKNCVFFSGIQLRPENQFHVQPAVSSLPSLPAQACTVMLRSLVTVLLALSSSICAQPCPLPVTAPQITPFHGLPFLEFQGIPAWPPLTSASFTQHCVHAIAGVCHLLFSLAA